MNQSESIFTNDFYERIIGLNKRNQTKSIGILTTKQKYPYFIIFNRQIISFDLKYNTYQVKLLLIQKPQKQQLDY